MMSLFRALVRELLSLLFVVVWTLTWTIKYAVIELKVQNSKNSPKLNHLAATDCTYVVANSVQEAHGNMGKKRLDEFEKGPFPLR